MELFFMIEPRKRPAETPIEWLRFAEENLLVAEQALSFEEPTWHTICFLCQSAAEKFLKAYLIAQGWKLERTHDIVVLLGLCADISAQTDSAFADLTSDGAILNEYAVGGRYPGDLAFEDIDLLDAQEAVAVVRRIKDLVTDRLSSSTASES
jgi:HEPN domain-containing protein